MSEEANNPVTIETPQGPGRLTTYSAPDRFATLLLSHGAGGGIAAIDLQALAAALPASGVEVVLFEQPWRVAGRKVAGAPATLDRALIAAVETLRRTQPDTPLVVGGRSAGARSAARVAAQVGASGLLALAFPVMGRGKTPTSRLPELLQAGVPTLVIQGERDSFGGPDKFPADLDLIAIPGGDHSLKVPKRGPIAQEDALAMVVEGTLEWIVREVGSHTKS